MANYPCPICRESNCISWSHLLSSGVMADDERTFNLGRRKFDSEDKITQCALRLACGISNVRGLDIIELVSDGESWISPAGCFPDWALPAVYKELERDPISLCHVLLRAVGEEPSLVSSMDTIKRHAERLKGSEESEEPFIDPILWTKPSQAQLGKE